MLVEFPFALHLPLHSTLTYQILMTITVNGEAGGASSTNRPRSHIDQINFDQLNKKPTAATTYQSIAKLYSAVLVINTLILNFSD